MGEEGYKGGGLWDWDAPSFLLRDWLYMALRPGRGRSLVREGLCLTHGIVVAARERRCVPLASPPIPAAAGMSYVPRSYIQGLVLPFLCSPV